MNRPTSSLRPEALPPVRSALPLLLALSTALLAGAIGGFLLNMLLPGDPPAPEVRRRIPVPACHTYGGALYHLVPASPDKPL